MRSVIYIPLFLLLQTALCQTYPVTNYNLADGLPHSNVFRAFQDARGFMFFCTDYGLCSYDGNKFKFISNDSLLNGAVLSVSETEPGKKLVCTTKEGVIVLTDSGATRLAFPNQRPPVSALYAMSKKGRVWLLAHDTNNLYEVRPKRVGIHKRTNHKGERIWFEKIVNAGDELLLTSNQGLFRIKDTTIEPFLPELIQGRVYDVKKNSVGLYWASLGNHVVCFNNREILKKFTFATGSLFNPIFCDRDNTLWLSDHNKSLWRIKNGVAENITRQLEKKALSINDFCQDHEGNIWICTYNSGLYKLNNLEVLDYQVEQGGDLLFCKSIAPLNERAVVISSFGHLYVWKDGLLKPLRTPFLKQQELVYFARRYGKKLFYGSPTRFFTSTLDGVHNLVGTKQFSTGVTSMCVDRNKKIWMGSFEKLYCYGQGGLVCDAASALLKNRRYNCIFEDKQGVIWFGTSTGLIKRWQNKYYQVKLPANKFLQRVFGITSDGYGRVWAATEGGLICFEKDTFKIFTTVNGLTHNKCNALAEDNNRILWVGTLRGLNYVDLTTLEIRNYCSAFFPEEITSLYHHADNRLFVGTANRLSTLSTAKRPTDDAAPPVFITKLKTTGAEVALPTSIKLHYRNTQLTVDFIAISFQDPNALEYRYKIGNQNSPWVYTTNTSLHLQALPPGTHQFELSARKNKGAWSKSVFLQIEVTTPIWQTWWFVFLGVVFTALLLFISARWLYKRAMRKKNERLAAINKELYLRNKVAYLKQQGLAALINPHFVFNCMNSIQHFMNRNEHEKANTYLADLANLMRITFQNAQDTFINLETELERIQLYLVLEQLRFGSDLAFTITVDKTIDPSKHKIPNMILQPYIENAIWHGIIPNNSKGCVAIFFEKVSESELRIRIEDNGVGITKSRNRIERSERKHFGMRSTEERLKLLSRLSDQTYKVSAGPLTVSGTEDAGTLIEIIVPLQPLTIDIFGTSD